MLQVVSKKLACGEDLDELVAEDVIPVLQSRLSIMSVAQRDWLAIDEEDIYFSFPYQVVYFQQLNYKTTLKLFYNGFYTLCVTGWHNIQ